MPLGAAPTPSMENAVQPNPQRTLIRWSTVAAAVCGFAGIAVYWAPGDRSGPPLPPEFAEEPDAYLEDGVITHFREDGSLHYRLRASRVTQFERKGLSMLASPTLELYQAQTSPWRVESRTGEVRIVVDPDGVDRERVELHGRVRLTQDRGDGAFTKVSTESLVFFPDQQRARTEQTVMIETDTVSVRAAGLEADLASGRMDFSSSTDQRVSIVVQPDQLDTVP